MLPAVRTQITTKNFPLHVTVRQKRIFQKLTLETPSEFQLFYSIKLCYIHVQKEWSMSKQKNWTVTQAQRHYKDFLSVGSYRHPLCSNCRNTMKLSADESWLASEAGKQRAREARRYGGEDGKTTCGTGLCAERLRTSPERGYPPLCMSPWYWRSIHSTEGWGGGNGGQKLLPSAPTLEGGKMESTPWWGVI